MKKYLLFLLVSWYGITGVFAQVKHITILHTNDVHSQIEPDKNNLGGMVRAATYINEVRKAEKNVLLISAGDFFQGSPYYNLFLGTVEIELMNAMQYDVACLGNHEFDNGMEALANQLRQAAFKIIAANYDVSQTALNGIVEPYTVIEKDGIKVGLFGIGIHLGSYAIPKYWDGLIISDPITTADTIAALLKEKERCDLVVCLTHIGYSDDIKLAERTRNIDVIIGGHSHTTLQQADVRKNSDGKNVTITQTGKSGLYVGRIDISMAR